MEGCCPAGSVQGALETQRELADRVIQSGVAAAPQQAGAAAGEQVRAAAMQEQGIGQKLNRVV